VVTTKLWQDYQRAGDNSVADLAELSVDEAKTAQFCAQEAGVTPP
jgi:hypothetical protein